MLMVEILSFVIKIVIGILVIESKSINLGIETQNKTLQDNTLRDQML